MKNKKITLKIIAIFVSVMVILLSSQTANAAVEMKMVEYTEEYKQWQELSEEEKEKTIEPRKYAIEAESNTNYIANVGNILKAGQLLSETVGQKYDLRTIIPNNVKVKNQFNLNTCWAFAGLATLESNLALRNTNSDTIYDFSERHLDYEATRSAFLNNAINEKGYTRKMSAGGNRYMAEAYLTNGSGAVAESLMPYKKNQDEINISELNKQVSSTVYDTVYFESIDKTDSTQKAELITKMKQHISNYGGIDAAICFPDKSDVGNAADYINTEKGAIYIDDTYQTTTSTGEKSKSEVNHAVTIIGWDDSYPKENFNQVHSPTSNGAWIIKNSHGNGEIAFEDAREMVYETAKAQEILPDTITSAEQITDEQTIALMESIQGIVTYKYDTEKNVFKSSIGGDGYLYISYEDLWIYEDLWGIEKAVSEKDYYNLYQHDELGSTINISATSTTGKMYIANVFERDSNIQEALDRVTIATNQQYTCKVYVNPKSDSKQKTDLQEIELAEGDSNNTVTFGAGYHTIEFAKPITLTGSSFAVVIEIQSQDIIQISLESNYIAQGAEEGSTNSFYKNAVANENESFVSTDMEEWEDLANYTVEDITISANATIKALTTDKIPTEPTEEEGEAKPSDFTNATASLTEAQAYLYTDENKEAYVTMKIKVNNIKIGDENNEYTYYYYLSGKKGDTNIKDEYWLEIPASNVIKESDGTYSVTLNVNSKDLPYIEEITESDNLYLYLKEVAKSGNQQKETITTLIINNNATPIFFVDDEKVGTAEEIVEQIQGQIEQQLSSKEDTTVSSTGLPKAGNVEIIAFGILVVIIIGGFAFYRYKNIDK